ncbi:UDP-N-acetylmuramoylalanyl-D-glutamyl-2, 6-diaminopimelate--D-alanyl-D-alanine ligase [Marinobacter salinus]|uniref:UDP-N-acetylmuramoyl-tripeptide--D-alanyl-D-alanine ligase n=1 Tax=Marinobacter salinus TaxID=1874317 RepID=A0A1D9GM87_9GAMM|nr:UDP-N-acetylmuramoyl-tripeptide--D-alanyl-D-alanine ligase [Marinobacter salinus]AOY88753.1 UDP-N-acetylmuramoylalanyl-D-glutamyl-2, 6-diaminopimelate--D-alanyl-D-alanine ligase [Marinobacter salinus]
MMRAFSLGEACRWTGAAGVFPVFDTLLFSGVSTDSRSIGKGQLFVALRGENFDGHRFLQKARDRGAIAAVVDTADDALDLPQLVVEDTIEALAQLAAGNRAESDAQLVAVTGSSGKTTVREMTGAILQQMGATLVTEGNLNNHIGVPLTLFGLAPEHRYGVIELGASGLGEIAHTVAITRPQTVILTNAGSAHLEGFGSYENIVIAKGEIIDGVADDGLVVLNRDDPAFEHWRDRAGERRVVSVSRLGHPEADYIGTRSGADLTVTGPGGWSCTAELALEGEHNISNALLAIAAARDFGADNSAISTGLTAVKPVKGRLQSLDLTPELTVIDDSYNANPASMKAAVGVLAKRSGKRIAVFGAMAELGPDARALHREVGECARDAQIERLLTVGPGCEGYAEGFGESTEMYQTHEQAVDAIIDAKQTPATVLVKGSRSSAMNRVVEGIKEKVNNSCCSG